MIHKIKRAAGPLLLALAAVSTLTGCQTYQAGNVVLKHWQAGDLAGAEQKATAKLSSHVQRDGVINYLEQATVLRAVGKYEESLKSFSVAEERINRYAEAAKTSLSGEAGKTFSNQAQAEYKGRDYDNIMMNTYKALDYLALGQKEEARTEIIRAYQRQQDAVEENKRRIEKAQQEKENSKEKDKVEQAENDEKFKSQYATNFGDLDSMQTYSDYVNPFTVFMDGLLYMNMSSGNEDLDRARNSFNRSISFSADNKFLKLDLETTESLVQGRPMTPTTYVIFETGRAPIRGQIRIDVPVFIGPGYVGAAFPKLELQNDYAPSLTVTTTNGSESTALIAKMDSVVGTAFKNELPSIITRTVISTVTKAVASYAAKQAAQQAGGDLGGILASVGSIAYGVAVNIADTRTWTTLPKEFQYCRLATPPDRRLELQTPNGQKVPVTLADGLVNVVYVRSIGPATPLIVSQFKLK